MTSARRSGLRTLVVFLPMVVAVACGDNPAAPELAMAKGSGGGANSTEPKVTAADPSFGRRGQRLEVRVIGTGFDGTAVASFERNGAPDPKITVNSTTFVSSSEVLADITIAADADTAFYDVAVEVTLSGGGRKKGVGVELFEVNLSAALDGAMVTAPQAARPHYSDGGNNLSLSTSWSPDRVVFPIVLNFVATHAAGTQACVPGDYGASPAEMAQMLARLVDPTPHIGSFAPSASGPFPSLYGNWIVLPSRMQADGYSWFFKVMNSETVRVRVDKSGNVYSYTGGLLKVMRATGQKGGKRDMICPNLDQIDLTFPVSP